MPPKKDDKKPTRIGRHRLKEEEPNETVAPPSDREILLKDEYAYFLTVACAVVILFL